MISINVLCVCDDNKVWCCQGVEADILLAQLREMVGRRRPPSPADETSLSPVSSYVTL